jgi:hypothetical protein
VSFEHVADIAKSEQQRPLQLTAPLGRQVIARAALI